MTELRIQLSYILSHMVARSQELDKENLAKTVCLALELFVHSGLTAQLPNVDARQPDQVRDLCSKLQIIW